MMTEKNMRIAIQKSGRLSQESQKLLSLAGIAFENAGDKLLVRAKGQAIDLMLVRDDDIPEFVENRFCQLGIVGLNILHEKLSDLRSVHIIRELNFGYCRLSLAAPRLGRIDSLEDLQGKRIATSYPQVLGAFLDKHQVSAKIVAMKGSVELAPSIGIADAICDLVSTGATLEAHALREILPIMQSQAVLIRPAGTLEPDDAASLQRLLQRIDAGQKAKQCKYIMMNAPKFAIRQICALIPGMEKPTVMPLYSDEEKVAIHAVAQEEIFWETMEKLKELGATSILVLPIEKLIE